MAEIVYTAVMETKIKFDNIDWLEGCKYIALTSTELGRTPSARTRANRTSVSSPTRRMD